MAVSISLFLLASCVSMNTEITIQSDGRVSAELNYQISQYVIGFGRIDNGDSFIPLPVEEEDFRQRSLQIEGADFSNYSYSEDEDYAYISANLQCDSMESLAAFLNIDILQTESGNSRSLSYIMVSEKEKTVHPEHKDLAEVLFANDTISLTINTPGAISSYSNGRLSDNRRSLVYNQDVLDMILGTDEVKLQLTYETGR